MATLNHLTTQKSDKYSINAKSKIYFADSISKVICKCGFPKRIEKSGNQICLDYITVLYTVKAQAQYCFEKKRLSSVRYVTDQLSKDDANHFLSEFENDIGNIMPISLCCEINGKKYWELSDGYASECICVYCENNAYHINMDYFVSQ
ncbi:MAG: hypothetical protein NC397_07220 [Clostridium sp.]|nr:hypothetical protein [Clostridium sp.]